MSQSLHALSEIHVTISRMDAGSPIVNALHFALVAVSAFAIISAEHSPRFDKWFWPLVFGLSGAIGAIAFILSAPPLFFSDFKLAYLQAGDAAWLGRDALIDVIKRGVNGFVNLPIVAYLFAPFALFPAQAPFLFSAIGALAILASWRLMTRMFMLSRRDSALLLLGLAAFGPLIYSVRQANSSHHLLLFMLLGLLAIRKDREVLGGALFGFAAVMKPPLLIIGVLFALRAKWKVVLGGFAVCAGFALASLAVFGWDAHVSWYELSIAPYGGHPLAAYNAQSFASFVARIETGLPGLINWDPLTLSTLGKGAVYAGSALLVALCVAACWGARPTPDQLEMEVFIAVTLVCLVSTLSWSHYFVWLAPAFALFLQRRSELGLWRWAALAAFILAAPIEFLSHMMRHGDYEPFTNLLTSHLTIAALIVLLTLARLRHGEVRWARSGVRGAGRS